MLASQQLILRHIVTEDITSPWFLDSKFVVDTWHYFGHKATDLLCRRWCNPAPRDGTQPDLIKVVKDRNRSKHSTRAFNTETAEQFNAFLSDEAHTYRSPNSVPGRR
jgi:hypothetical protein